MAGRTDPIASRLAFECASLGPLPTHAPDLGPLAEVLVHSTGRVRFQTNDYSVPIQFAYQRVTLKADPFRVHVFAGEELVADQPRCYQKRQVIEDWRHYVPLLLKKSFAVPWASALRHGDLPPTFEAARRRVSGSTCRWQSGVCPAPGTVSDPRGFGGRDRPGPGTRAEWLECGCSAAAPQLCQYPGCPGSAS